MITASAATARNQLSRLLRRVKLGESILITDRNRPVARLVPVESSEGHGSEVDVIGALMHSGVVCAPTGQRLDVEQFLAAPRPALRAGTSLARAVIEDREEA